jgi:hypothetical protein
MLAKRFHMAVKRYGLNKESKPMSLTKFRKPARTGDQLSLFDPLASEPRTARI